MKKKSVHIIWSEVINLEDWRDFLEEEHPDVTDEYEQYDIVDELNLDYLDDERANLNKYLPNGIICICTIGRWNGSFGGYLDKELKNIADCLYGRCESMSSNTFYVDRYNLCHDEAHHDGTNYYVYRAWKDGVTEEQKDRVKDALYLDKDSDKSKRLISRYTRSLAPDVRKAYGW